MKQSILQSGMKFTFAVWAATSAVGAHAQQRSSDLFSEGSIRGVIQDAEGVPQMGALVQAILPNATLGGSAITDARGRYHFAVAPGSYRVRATAALLLPAIRERLQVTRGTRAVVDLTLTTMLAPNGWLPVSRRSVAEPSDDWMWTLRSSASRSILRLNGQGDGEDTSKSSGATTVSSSRQEARRGVSGGRITLQDSDGGFGRGGSHNILLLTRLDEDGSAAVLRADLSGTRSPYPVAPSAEITVGMQRRMPLNGVSRALLTYSNHPELVDGRGMTGMQAATLRSGERIEVGDLLRIDAGSVMRDSNLGGNVLVVEPFLHISARTGEMFEFAYSMTRSRGTETLEDFDRIQAATPMAVMRDGHLKLESGMHQALSGSGKIPGGGVVEVAVFRDLLRNPLIAGTGTFSAAELQATAGILADPTTHTYRVAARDYSSAGVRLSVHQPVTKSMQAGLEVSTGKALRSTLLQGARLSDVLDALTPAQALAATAFADGKILKLGTTLRASYRWQPARTVTAVDGFRLGEDGAFLSCSVRQSLGKTHFLPQGLEAVVDLQNLLAEGYQPFLSNDGQTLYLAQTPRTLRAGLSFSF